MDVVIKINDHGDSRINLFSFIIEESVSVYLEALVINSLIIMSRQFLLRN